nr:uncharacterized protein LOC111750050 [Loxodonta africana]
MLPEARTHNRASLLVQVGNTQEDLTVECAPGQPPLPARVRVQVRVGGGGARPRTRDVRGVAVGTRCIHKCSRAQLFRSRLFKHVRQVYGLSNKVLRQRGSTERVKAGKGAEENGSEREGREGARIERAEPAEPRSGRPGQGDPERKGASPPAPPQPRNFAPCREPALCTGTYNTRARTQTPGAVRRARLLEEPLFPAAAHNPLPLKGVFRRILDAGFPSKSGKPGKHRNRFAFGFYIRNRFHAAMSRMPELGCLFLPSLRY